MTNKSHTHIRVYTLPSVKIRRGCNAMYNVSYEGGDIEDRNLYHCDPWVKTKIFNLGFL